MEKTNNQKTLIIAPNWLGDAVMSLPIVQYLAQNVSDDVSVLANNLTSDVYKNSPAVKLVFIRQFEHGKLELFARFNYARHVIAKEKFSKVFVLPNSLKSTLIPFFARIPQRIGFVGEWRYLFINKIYKNPLKHINHQAIEYLSLIENFDFAKTAEILKQFLPKLTPDIDLSLKALNNFNINRSIAVICAGAEYGVSKQWSAYNYHKCAKHLMDKGFGVLLLGSKKDYKISEEIKNSYDNDSIINLCGLTTISIAIYLLSIAKITISNDSGLMHLGAALLNKKSYLLAIFGSTTPSKTRPLSIYDDNISIFENTEIKCRPCFSRTCKFLHYKCLTQISAQSVINKINTILDTDN